jgi:hypothetical protein
MTHKRTIKMQSCCSRDSLIFVTIVNKYTLEVISFRGRDVDDYDHIDDST